MDALISRIFGRIKLLLLFLAFGLGCADSVAQQTDFPDEPPADEPPLRLIGNYFLESGTRTGFLILKAEIADGSHIYSLTQKGNPPATKIRVPQSPNFKIVGDFHSDKHPLVIESDPVFDNRIEKHTKTVQFFVPIEIADGIEPEEVVPELNFTGQVCSDSGVCMPFRNQKIPAKFGGFYEADRSQDSSMPKKR